MHKCMHAAATSLPAVLDGSGGGGKPVPGVLMSGIQFNEKTYIQ